MPQNYAHSTCRLLPPKLLLTNFHTFPGDAKQSQGAFRSRPNPILFHRPASEAKPPAQNKQINFLGSVPSEAIVKKNLEVGLTGEKKLIMTAQKEN